MTEGQLQRHVLQLAGLCGWLTYHTHDSRRSEAGFPDLVGVRADRLFFAELKREDEEPTRPQELWLSALGRVHPDVYLWRPSDWPQIQQLLTSR
jgi:hypothetical protein